MHRICQEGLGGFDLYYSVFRNGKWSSPVNMGPEINSPANEYRPVLGIDLKFENRFLIFSSDRPVEREVTISISRASLTDTDAQ